MARPLSIGTGGIGQRIGRWAAVAAAALLCGLYARGGAAWPLGFLALVPWLRTLDSQRTLGAALLVAWAMSVAYAVAVFGWFAAAIGNYMNVGEGAGMAILLVGAPLFQPQFITFAVMRCRVGRRHGALLRALAAAASWVATEALVPRLLGDTLGDGLYPSRLLRQAADLFGTTGLTFALLLSNEAIAAAIARRAEGTRAWVGPLALAALVPMLLSGYGFAVLSARPALTGQTLRMGLVQSDIVDYERLRRAKGTYAAVREILDTHVAMSLDAIEHYHADAILWSETVYPTTFGHPKSEAGAAFDREILEMVDSAGVPFVFGTYDRDAHGEYNAAAFVVPGAGLLGFYRKTRLFPLTEAVPAWLDGPALRRALPWAGTWKSGTGARVLPLRLADGREIPVLPLICLDDVDAGLAIDGARLGAQVILTLSNDSWFTADGQGAALHQAVAAFRSIETRLPQFRVTANGLSAVIDATGTVIAGARMGERTLVIGQVQAAPVRATLMVAWGDWVGRAAAAGLLLWVVAKALRRWCASMSAASSASRGTAGLPADVAVLPPSARLGAALLRTLARGSLPVMAAAIVLGDGALQGDSAARLRLFVLFFVIPEAAAWCVLRAFAARASLEHELLVFTRGRQRLQLASRDIAAVEPWRLPMPASGVSLRLASGQRWRYAVAHPDPRAFAHALAAELPDTRSALAAYVRARAGAARRGAHRRLVKLGLFPLLLALPAFRLHQHIAYGSTFGEYTAQGLQAYLATFAQWWAAWAVGVALWAGLLRAVVEAIALVGARLQPPRAAESRPCLERLGLLVFYVGPPAWLALRVLGPP